MRQHDHNFFFALVKYCIFNRFPNLPIPQWILRITQFIRAVLSISIQIIDSCIDTAIPTSSLERDVVIFLMFFDIALDAEKVQIGIFMKKFIDERCCIGHRPYWIRARPRRSKSRINNCYFIFRINKIQMTA